MKPFLILALTLLLLVPGPWPLVTAYCAEPAIDDLTIQAGEDFNYTILLKSSTGAALNLTGYTFAAQVRTTYAEGAPLATFTTSVTPLTGTVVLTLPRATTAGLALKKGVWDLRQTDPNGDQTYLLRGAIRFVPVVTR